MQLLNVTQVPIYIPGNFAELPFGDPFSTASCTLASPGVFTVPGYYNPKLNDQISFTIPVGGGTLPVAITAGTVYFVVNPTVTNAVATFNVSATKGGAGINTATASTGIVTAHLLNAQQDGPVDPFVQTASAVVLNLTGGTLVLQGAPDLNTTGYGNPQGPGTYVTLASVPTLSAALAVLNYDWIRCSTAATLVLLQN